ncbi:MAG TPA: pirin family protein [Burkholderiales bacterium]|nr:pirin family protein [Burkholderiales bacterium]
MSAIPTERRAARAIRSSPAEPAPGLEVMRPLPGPDIELLGPFLLLDHFGPKRVAPGDYGGLNPHPHRGFETVTLILEGAMEHQDSSGGQGVIRPGGVQWMTAASGIVHAEYHEREFARQGGSLHGIQLWVNLPARFKMEPPKYQDLPAERIPVIESGGARIRVVAGSLLGAQGPAKTYTPVTVAHLTLSAGARIQLPVPAGQAAGVYAIRGSGSAGGRQFSALTLIEFENSGETIALSAAEPADLLLIAGEPIDEPVVAWGPFVMNTSEEILQARKDFAAGRMGTLNPRVPTV